MLQLAQRTEAPRSARVTMSTAVWMVMCSEPVMRTPSSGRSLAYLRRMAIRPGISCSAMEISLRPQSARERSATLNPAAVWFGVRTLIFSLLASINLDTLILECFCHGVNPKIPAAGGGPKPTAAAVAAGAGRAVGGGAAGDPDPGAEPDFDPPGAVEAGRPGGRPAGGEERLLPSESAGGADEPAAQSGARNPRSG